MADQKFFTSHVNFDGAVTAKGAITSSGANSFSGKQHITEATDAAAKDTACALKVAGGVAVEKKVHAGLGITTDAGGLTVTAGASTFGGDVQCKSDFKAPNSTNTLGTELANDTAAITLTSADHGKTFLCALSNAAKTVNLPASMTATHIGTKIQIVQKVDLIGSGVLTINSNTANIFSANSIGAPNTGGATVVANGSSNNSLVITGAGTNSSFGAGSRITATVIAAGVWHVEIFCVPLGAGNTAFAFSG